MVVGHNQDSEGFNNMALLDKNIRRPTRDSNPELKARRQALRQQIINARGSSYTYRDPDLAARRSGRRITDDGRIINKL